MPLGFALITSSILSRLEIGSRRVFLSLIVTISLLINQSNYFSLIKDNNKQLDIITQLDNYPLNENVDFVFFEDDTKEDNALNRKYRFFEWQGILNRAYPKNKGIIALETKDIELVKNIFKSNQQDYFGYQIKNLPDEINIAKMKITYKDFSNEKLSKAKLLNHILFKKRKFKKIVLEGSECENIRTQDLDLDNYPNFTCKKIL